MSALKDCITKHGAAAVYNAAIARLAGNHKPLKKLGLVATDLAEANRIMTAAFGALTPKERRADNADISRAMHRIGRPPIGDEVRKRYQIMLEPTAAEKLRQLGGGNLSRGITLAAAIADNQKGDV